MIPFHQQLYNVQSKQVMHTFRKTMPDVPGLTRFCFIFFSFFFPGFLIAWQHASRVSPVFAYQDAISLGITTPSNMSHIVGKRYAAGGVHPPTASTPVRVPKEKKKTRKKKQRKFGSPHEPRDPHTQRLVCLVTSLFTPESDVRVVPLGSISFDRAELTVTVLQEDGPHEGWTLG